MKRNRDFIPAAGIVLFTFFTLFIAAITCAAAPCPTPGFEAGAKISTGKEPVAVVAADFNDDRKQDLAVVNSGSNDIWIFLGDGSGALKMEAKIAVGEDPRAITAADFDGDKLLDLAVVNYKSNDVSLLLGDGKGHFRAGTTVAAETNPVAIAIADFNEDKKPDLVVANSKSNSVSVLLNKGKGAGQFSPAVKYAVGKAPIAIAAGDLNGDGRRDLAVANYGGNNVAVIFGDKKTSYLGERGSPLIFPRPFQHWRFKTGPADAQERGG